ncbi:MAG TPA: hypothetical protein DD670_03575 [Planctomycetaceae bacterium]|nr:hypothetical protein [Planctomycetaceae bacterium]
MFSLLLCGMARAGVSDVDGPPFVGRLALGTVELVGITYYQKTNSARVWNRARWWRADGSAAQIGPFRPRGTHELDVFADIKTLTFLVRVTLPSDTSQDSLADKQASSGTVPSNRHGPFGQPSYARADKVPPPADASWPAWEFSNPPHWRNPTPMRWEGFRVADVRANTLPDFRMVSAHFDAYTETADFRVSVSTSAYEWKTVATRKPDAAGTSTFVWDERKVPVTLFKARKLVSATSRASAGSTQVTLTIPHDEMYGKFETRLVAIDDGGKEHASLIGYYGDRGTAVFRGVPLSSIKEFQLQVRPCDWVEFRNVSLQPGYGTAVTVVSSVDCKEK